jgi:hypothetical protein
MWGFLLVAVLSAAYNLFEAKIDPSGHMGLAAGEARDALGREVTGAQRTAIGRIAEFVALGAPAISCVVLVWPRRIDRIAPWVAAAIPLLAAIAKLAIGSRNSAVVPVGLLCIAVCVRLATRPISPIGRKALIISMLAALVLLLLVSSQLFAWRRGATDFSNVTIDQLGGWKTEPELRPLYKEIDQWSGGGLRGLAMILMYVGHAPAFFCELFTESNYGEELHYGLFQFRLFEMLGSGSGEQFRQRVDTMPFVGRYPTAIHGSVLDFGLVLTPLFLIGLGVCIGLVWRAACSGKEFGLAFIPIALLTTAATPIYYFFWGGLDFVWFWALLIWALVRMAGVRHKQARRYRLGSV